MPLAESSLSLVVATVVGAIAAAMAAALPPADVELPRLVPDKPTIDTITNFWK